MLVDHPRTARRAAWYSPALSIVALLATASEGRAADEASCRGCPPMIAVPAGRFTMGSSGTETVEQGADARRVGNERPANEVTIVRSFRLGAREVTRG